MPADAPCDADVVFVTHDHYDHFSPEDIRRVMKPGAVLVLPETCVAAALRAGFTTAQLLPVRPGEAYTVQDLPFTAVAAGLAAALRPQIAVPTHYGCIVGERTDGAAFAAALPADISAVQLIRQ